MDLSRDSQDGSPRFAVVGSTREFRVLKISRVPAQAGFIKVETHLKYVVSSRQKKHYNVEWVKWNPLALHENLILTSAVGGNIYLWDVTRGTEFSRKFENHSMKSRFTWSHFDPNSFFSGSLDKNLLMWDIRLNTPVTKFMNGFDKIKHVSSSPKNQF